MQKTCVVCGKQFTPVLRHHTVQKLCSPECRSRYNREHSLLYHRNPQIRAEKIKHYYEDNPTYCRICGKQIVRTLIQGTFTSNSRMHDECILEDCRRTLMCGSCLNHIQQLRLAYRGYGIKEFKAECVKWREEHMPMINCNQQIMSYIPHKYQLAVHNTGYDLEDNTYVIEMRTDFKDGVYVIKQYKFKRLQDIRTFYRDYRKAQLQNISSNFQK